MSQNVDEYLSNITNNNSDEINKYYRGKPEKKIIKLQNFQSGVESTDRLHVLSTV